MSDIEIDEVEKEVEDVQEPMEEEEGEVQVEKESEEDVKSEGEKPEEVVKEVHFAEGAPEEITRNQETEEASTDQSENDVVIESEPQQEPKQDPEVTSQEEDSPIHHPEDQESEQDQERENRVPTPEEIEEPEDPGQVEESEETTEEKTVEPQEEVEVQTLTQNNDHNENHSSEEVECSNSEKMEDIVDSEFDALRLDTSRQTENNNENDCEVKQIKKSGIRPPAVVLKNPKPTPPTSAVASPRTTRPTTTPAPRVTPKTVPSPRPVSKMSRERSDVRKSTSTKSIDNVGKFTPKMNAKFVNVKSKVGSVSNHTPGGGNVEIFSEKREYNARSKVGSLHNTNHVAGGGNVKIESRKLDFSHAAPKVGSVTNYVPPKSDVKIMTEKLQWNAQSKVGSMENASRKPAGGNVQILHQKLNWKAESKVGSKDNIRHRPGGGNVKVVSSELAISRPTVIHVAAKPKMAATPMDKKNLKRKSVSQRSSTASLSHSVHPKPFPGAIYPLSSDYVFRNKTLERKLELAELWHKSITFDAGDARKSRRILSNKEHFIFVGGVPRSGTTLMRAILDAHPDVRCGGETMLLPNFMTWQSGWRKSEWVNNSGITDEVMDDAISAFITEIIGKHGDMADRLCNKDPYTALWLPTLRRLFPNAKYILMIRDARAIIHSMIERNVPVAGYNTSDEKQMFQKWNSEIRKMYFQCSNSAGLCLKVHYERLIQKPKDEIARITSFLDIPFSDAMLRHEEFIGQEIELNDQEFSASQVKNSINKTPLTSWFDCFDKSLLEKLDDIAPFLSFLGYDTTKTKPSYARFASDNFYRNRNPYL